MNLFLVLHGEPKCRMMLLVVDMIEPKLGVFKINFRSGHFNAY